MFGNLGDDVFVLQDNSGSDVINGFVQGTDLLQIQQNINGLSISSPADLLTRVSSDANGNAVIDLGNGNQVTLVGITAAEVSGDIDNMIDII